MNEQLKNKIDEVESLIEKYKYDEAIVILRSLADEYQDEGVIPYYFGQIAMIGNNEQLALRFFVVAERKEYKSIDLYLSIAVLSNRLGFVNDAEKYFEKAVKLSNSDEEKWLTWSSLAVFYMEHAMYLKAEKISKILINEQPNAYQGYHIHVVSESLRRNIDEVVSYIEKIPEKFKSHPQYLMDIIEVYKLQDKNSELEKLFETDERFMQIIPQIVLREKITNMPSNKETVEEKEKLIFQHAKEYHDSDAIMSYMIIQFAKRNFNISSKYANVILNNELSNQGFKFFLALYFQIFNLYYLSEEKPSKKLREWIEKAGNWCVDFSDRANDDEISVTVRDSIQELFDRINGLCR